MGCTAEELAARRPLHEIPSPSPLSPLPSTTSATLEEGEKEQGLIVHRLCFPAPLLLPIVIAVAALVCTLSCAIHMPLQHSPRCSNDEGEGDTCRVLGQVGDVITALVLASSLLESLPAFLGPSTICLKN